MNQINELSQLITINMNGNLKVDPPTAGELAAAIIDDGWIDGNKLWGSIQARIEWMRTFKNMENRIESLEWVKEQIEGLKQRSK